MRSTQRVLQASFNLLAFNVESNESMEASAVSYGMLPDIVMSPA